MDGEVLHLTRSLCADIQHWSETMLGTGQRPARATRDYNVEGSRDVNV